MAQDRKYTVQSVSACEKKIYNELICGVLYDRETNEKKKKKKRARVRSNPTEIGSMRVGEEREVDEKRKQRRKEE